MSSTSSSDYDNCPGLCYCSGYRIAGSVPIYPNVGGHPLIYYAHIPQDCKIQRNKTNKKNSPNCFVKAFRWYTQELPSPQAGTPCNNVNIGGFAAWLDAKYEEFLNDSKCEQNCPPFKSKQCSFTESNRLVNGVEHASRKEKKFSRLKSPWKKKRHFIHEPERGDLFDKHSFEYLLKPQDISKAASECCQRTSSCNRSDATYIASKSPVLAKIKVKSHSTICLTKVRDVLERQINVTNYDEDTCNINSQTSTKATGIVIDHTKVTTKQYDYKSPKKLKGKGVICECKRDGNNYRNVMTQYSKSSRINNIKTADCQCSLYKIERNDVSCQHYQTKSSSILKKETCAVENCYPPCCQCRPAPDSGLCKPEQFYQQYCKINSATSLKQDSHIAKELLAHSVQTSDHSIVFQEDPLVVKILCEKK